MTYKDITMCIPRVENLIPKEFIYKKLCKINAGKIKHIIEKPLKKEKNFKRLLIKMTINQNNQNGAYILDRFSRGENVKMWAMLGTEFKLSGGVLWTKHAPAGHI